MIGLGRLRSAKPRCPAGWEITRALSQPETSADVVRHVRDCSACAGLAAELGTVISVAAELLPVAPMSQASRERIRAALGAASADGATTKRARRSSAAWALAAGLVGMAVLAGGGAYVARKSAKSQVSEMPQAPTAVAEERGTPSGSLAKVRLFGEASFRRLADPPDEIVRLASGRAAFEVTHLSSTQRFRVIAGDGEVEVRGTRFEVEARDGILWTVAVAEGKVDVRVGDGVLRLQGGDEWHRQRPSSAAERPQKAASSARLAEHELSRDSLHDHGLPQKPQLQASQASQANRENFALAWAHLRHSEWDEATRDFGAVAAHAHGRALEEDALYWQAVATARAGHTQQASALFETFLQRFQEGAHTGAATLALAWLRFDAGERESARVLFERAARDSSAKVRQGADEGLRRLRIR
jgi:TolA-binding protein